MNIRSLILLVTILALSLSSVADIDLAAGSKAVASSPQQGWMPYAGTGGFALGSEKIRSQLDLSEEQEKAIALLVADSTKLWKDHLAGGLVERDKIGAEAFAILTGPQKARLKKLKVIEGSWFSMAGNARNLSAIGLDDDREKQVLEILAAHQKERTAAFQSVSRVDPATAERVKKNQKLNREMLIEVKNEVRGILSDKQFDTLLTEVAKIQFQSIAQQRRLVKEIGLSEKQSEQLADWVKDRNRTAKEIGQIKDATERMEKWKTWREESGARAFAILTDIQKSQVKKFSTVESMWFSALRWPGMIERIGAVEETKQKLEKSLADYQKKRTEAFRPSPEVVAKSREVQKKYKEMIESAKSEIREVFTDGQFDALLTRIATIQIPYLYRRPDVAEELDLSDEQVSQIEETVKKGHENSRDRAAQVETERRKLYEKAEMLLTPGQKKKLGELTPKSRPMVRIQREGGQGKAGGELKPESP